MAAVAPPSNPLEDVKDMLWLSSAYFVASASFVAMKTTDTALLGHLGAQYLDAVAYSDLYTSASGVLIKGDVLSVFCAQAYGSGNLQLVGTWLKVSYVFVGTLGAPVCFAWALTPQALLGFGVANQLMRRKAGLYARVLAICIPARIGYSQLSKFFTSQNVTQPSYISLAAVAANAGLGVGLVIGAGLGFPACPAVTTAVEYIQLGLMVVIFCVYRQLHARCRPTVGWWSLQDVTRPRVCQFARLYAPTVAATASDFWRLSAVGTVAATISKDALGVFSASYRIMWMSLALAGSFGAAVGTKVAVALGAGDPMGARRVTEVGLLVSVSLLLLLATIVLALPRQLGMIFTNDRHLLDLFEDARYELAATVFFMNLACVLERVPIACGRTKLVFVFGFVASWSVQVPAVLACVHYWHHSLRSVYLGVTLGYAVLCVLYLALVLQSDFHASAAEAAVRSEVADYCPAECSATEPIVSSGAALLVVSRRDALCASINSCYPCEQDGEIAAMPDDTTISPTASVDASSLGAARRLLSLRRLREETGRDESILEHSSLTQGDLVVNP